MPHSFNLPDILRALFAEHFLSSKEALRVHRYIDKKNTLVKTHPLEAILSAKAINKKTNTLWEMPALSEWFAQYSKVPYFTIDPLKIDISKITSEVAYQYAKQNQILVVQTNTDAITIASKNPFNDAWIESLSSLLRKEVHLVFANPQDVDRYLDEFYSLAKSLHHSDKEQVTPQKDSIEKLVHLAKSGQLDTTDHHIIQIVDWLLQYAFEQRASDIHIEPRQEKAQIRFRIDGILHDVYSVPRGVMLAIISRLKTLSNMDISEKRRPLDGRLKTSTQDNEVELRISTIPTALGEKMVMRIFDPTVLQRNFIELGFSQQELNQWEVLTQHSHGIILVTGPTGSGKTTTLYSTLRKLASNEVNVCTIEDPVEMLEPKFNQMQVRNSVELDFATGLRALLRQDPDIIMIGEIRDLATAEMAVQAALTGHLVISTLHTNSTPAAITRLTELGVPAYLINATLLGIMAQRLVRAFCPQCKTPTNIDSEQWQRFCNHSAISEHFFHQAPGCVACRHTGYSGRIGLYEIMPITPELKKLITDKPDIDAIRTQAQKQGVRSLRENGANKVASGLTSIQEIMRVTSTSEYE